MKIPAIPVNESQRLADLEESALAFSPAEERFDRITILARQVFDVPIALLSLVTGTCQWFKSAQGLTADQTPREISFCGHAILHDDTFIVSDAATHPDFADNPLVTGAPHIRFYAGHPVQYKGSAIGTICLIDTRPRELSEAQKETLRSLATWVESELSVQALSMAQVTLLRERDQARRDAMIDPLTKVWNRKGMDELLTRELEHAKRSQQPVVAMMVDLDHFKDINDEHGHMAGDIVLKEVAQRLRATLRPYDVIARFGGDEYFVLATDCAPELGRRIGERICRRINEEPVTVDGVAIPITVSVGIAAAQATLEPSRHCLLNAADEALYEAKEAGRNCMRYREVELLEQEKNLQNDLAPEKHEETHLTPG